MNTDTLEIPSNEIPSNIEAQGDRQDVPTAQASDMDINRVRFKCSFAFQLAENLADAFFDAGFSSAEVAGISVDRLKEFKGLLRGYGRIEPVRFNINLGVDPFLPEGWAIQSSRMYSSHSSIIYREGDGLYINSRLVRCVPTTDKKKSSSPLPAQVLDYLLAHPYLIPDSWKRMEGHTPHIFFEGTVFKHNTGGDVVRGMYHDGERYKPDVIWTDSLGQQDFYYAVM